MLFNCICLKVAWRLKLSNIRVWKILMRLGNCWLNRNFTHRGISLSVIRATVPVSMGGTLVCTVLWYQDCFTKTWDPDYQKKTWQLVAQAVPAEQPVLCHHEAMLWHWERPGVPRVTTENKFWEIAQWEEVLTKNPKQQHKQKCYVQKETEKDQTTVHCVPDKNVECSCYHSQTQHQSLDT